jgi:hypothetical protein
MKDHYMLIWGASREAEIDEMVSNHFEMADVLRATGFADPEAKHHQHSPLDKVDYITDEHPDPLFMEWVYVIDPEERTMTIFHSWSKYNYKQKKLKPGEVPPEEEQLDKDGYWIYPSGGAYKHVKVLELELDAKEPDWQMIDDVAMEIADSI